MARGASLPSCGALLATEAALAGAAAITEAFPPGTWASALTTPGTSL